jgi:hypothetical protein
MSDKDKATCDSCGTETTVLLGQDGKPEFEGCSRCAWWRHIPDADVDEQSRPHEIVVETSPTYRVLLLKRIRSSITTMARTDAWVYHEMETTFAPPPGIYLMPHMPAREVHWVEDRMFLVYTDPDEEMYQAAFNRGHGPARAIEAIVADWEKEGWSMLGFGAYPPIENLEDDDGQDGD